MAEMKKVATLLLLLVPVGVMAQEAAGKEETQAKTLSGISIVGNNEAPKALYIVPWKSSEVGLESKLKSALLDEGLVPVDRDVFTRQLEFHETSNAN